MVVLLMIASAAPASQTLPPGVRWTVALPAPPASAPVIAGNRIFLSTLPGVLRVLALHDGRELWQQAINADQPVVVEGERVYVAAGEAIHALGVTDGALAWRAPTGVLTAPVLVKDGWIIAASAAKLFAIRASDGQVIWSLDSGPQRERAAISGDLLFVPLASGFMRAHDLSTGAVRWERRLAGAPAEPLIVGDRLYAGATDKRFYRMKTQDGENDWPPIRVGAMVRTQAAADGERVFFAGLDNTVRAVRRSGGSQKWLRGVPFRPFEGPKVIGPAVVVAGNTTEVRLLNILDGRDAGKIIFPEPLALAPAFGVLDDGVVAAGVSGGLTEAWKLTVAAQPPAPQK